MVRFFLYLLLAWLPVLHSQNYPVRVGDTTVLIQQKTHGSGRAFVHLHQSEITARHAAESVMEAEGGSLLTLVHPGHRNIVFRLHKKRFEFDPNRIFTDVGIKKTLKEFGPYTPKAHAEVKKLAKKITQLLPKGKIIAVHNNHEAYSLRAYFPGHRLARDVRALNYFSENPVRNFYLVTQKDDFFRLRHLSFNSIWQKLHATDDGSLSVYLAGRKYVNVEAGYDQLSEQIDMLKHA